MPIITNVKASGGGSIPDPITTTINSAPAGLGTGALAITAATLSNAIAVTAPTHDGSSNFLSLTNNSGQALQINDTGGAIWNLFTGGAITVAGSDMNGVFEVTADHHMGFFGAASVAQPAATDVATALQTLGLVAAGALGAAFEAGIKSGQQTSGALSTLTIASGTGRQISTASDRETHTPVTFNPGVATTATCLVELSPDNTTYSPLATITKPVGTVFDGEIEDVVVRVPAGWYIRLTVNAQASIGTTTYY